MKKIQEGFIGQKMIVLPPDVLQKLDNSRCDKFYITAVGYYPNANYHDRSRKNGCNEYIFLYCTNGEGMVEIENEHYNIYPNHYVVIPRNIKHHYRSSLKTPWTIYWVHFIGEQSDKLFNRFYEVGYSNAPKKVAYNESQLRNFLNAISILEGGFDDKNLEITNIMILSIMASMIYKDQLNPSETAGKPMQKSVKYIQENLSNKIKVEDLAEQENLSVSRFCELFKEKTGYSPIQYVLLKKIQKSCQFLYFTELSVKEIAKKVGFEDPYYFSRAFKNVMGLPPSKYKKSYKK